MGIIEKTRTEASPRAADFDRFRLRRFVESLPRSHYGKVIRAELIAQAASHGVDLSTKSPPAASGPSAI